MGRRGRSFHGGGTRQKGAAAVEFALVFMLFLSVFYAIVCYGLIFAAEQSLTLAAEEGARAAVQDAASQADRLDNARNTATGLVNWLSGTTVTATASPCAANPAVSCVTVTVSYDYKANPLVPPLPFLSVKVPDTLRSTATVQL